MTAQGERLKDEKSEQKKFWDGVHDTISKGKEFKGISIQEKDKAEFFDFLSKPVTAQGHTKRDQAYIDADTETKLAIDYLLFKGFDTKSIIAKYKTIIIANRRAYIGNVFQNSKAYGDRLLKTGPNQFDIYTEGNWIDVVINDGDYITTMVTYADRIFQFKRRNLYILNLAEDTEFLEGQYLNYGVMHPSQVCVSSYGVFE